MKNPVCRIFPITVSRQLYLSFRQKKFFVGCCFLRSNSLMQLPLHYCVSAGILTDLVSHTGCTSPLVLTTLSLDLQYYQSFSCMCSPPGRSISAPIQPPHFSILQQDSSVAAGPLMHSLEEQAGILPSCLHTWAPHRGKFAINSQ